MSGTESSSESSSESNAESSAESNAESEPKKGPENGAGKATGKKQIFAWLELIRLPNAFTIPGDLLAGLLLASTAADSVPWIKLAFVIPASLCFYFAGMALNDISDFKEDLEERPDRPLPSGRITPNAATNLVGVLCLLGLILCSFVNQHSLMVGAVLIGFIFAYNLFAKSILVFGPLCMGLCRGVNFLLGVSCMPTEVLFTNPVVSGFHAMTIYVAMVTMLARNEMTARNPGINRNLPALVLIVAFVGMPFTIPDRSPLLTMTVYAILAGTAVFLALDAGRCMKVMRMVTPPMIGQMLGALILIQAAFIAASGWPLIGLALVILWPINARVRKWIAAS